MDLNKAMLIGNVGKDPEFRNLQSGDEVVNFSLATNRSWQDKQSGERKQLTQWHNVVSFNKNIVDVCKRFVQKGCRLYLEGEITHRKWIDKNTNAERWTTEIVIPPFGGQLIVLSGGKQAGATQTPARNGAAADDADYTPPQQRGGKPAEATRDFDDDIPF